MSPPTAETMCPRLPINDRPQWHNDIEDPPSTSRRGHDEDEPPSLMTYSIFTNKQHSDKVDHHIQLLPMDYDFYLHKVIIAFGELWLNILADLVAHIIP